MRVTLHLSSTEIYSAGLTLSAQDASFCLEVKKERYYCSLHLLY